MREAHRRTRRERAFTVLELLVVTAIIGALIGLLFPALMAAREYARRLQCKSNLREIGLAIQQRHEAVKKLPEAWTAASDRMSGYGWAVALLPYLEESDLSNSIGRTLPISDDRNESPRSTDLAIMRCPSDISDPTFELLVEMHDPPVIHASSSMVAPPLTADETVPLVRLPTANYLGVYGTLEADESFPAPAGDGPIISDRAVRFADLQRGQSHTLIVGERTAAMVPSTWLGVDFQGEDAACRLVGSAMTTPNCETCDECEFGSRHSGGSNFVWADGHVSLVPDDIDTIVYQGLAKRRMD